MMKNYELLMLCARFDFGETKAIAKAVLVALASYYNEDLGGSWPGQKTLLPCASCDRKSLMKMISWLEKQNLIRIERSLGKGNFYRFNIELLKTGFAMPIRPENRTTPECGTATENGNAPVPNSGLGQSQKEDYTYPENGTQNINIKENLNKKETNKYLRQDEEDAPFIAIKTLLDNISVTHRSGLKDDGKQILSAAEMRNIARINRVELNLTKRLNQIASRRTITTEIFQECIKEYQKNPHKIGWLVGMLENVSNNPIQMKKKIEVNREIKKDLVIDNREEMDISGIDNLDEDIPF